MALIITVTHQKGGVGKTTISLNLMKYFERNGVRCAVVDTDAQGTITQLYDTFKDNDNWKGFNLITPKDYSDIQELKELDYDVIIIDTPPYLSTQLPSVFAISDCVLFPCKPSPADLLAIRSSIKLLDESKKSDNIKVGVVLSMAKSGTDFNDQIVEKLKEFEVNVFNTYIYDRIAYSRSLLEGSSVYISGDKKAINEVDNLGQEILTYLQQ
jgi:chromosome partitioning protein